MSNDLMSGERHSAIYWLLQYDIVLMDNEIGGGGIRNHVPEALKKVFEIMG